MEQLFGAIPGVLDKLGPNAEINEAVVIAAWGRCAGELLRTRTSAIEFFEGRLVVAVADKTWQRHLEELSPQMLYKINSSLGNGTVRFIEFRVDPKALKKVKNAGAKGKTDDRSMSNVTPSLIKAAGAIADEGLRHVFLSAAESYLERQGGGK